MIRVIVANTNNCRVFDYDKAKSKLTAIKILSHPESRLKAIDGLTSDKPGRFNKGESSRGAYSPHMEPNEVEHDIFAREVAAMLDHDRNENAYEGLIVICAPHMHGLINKHLNKHVKEMIVNAIQKDIQHISEPDLLEFLKSHAQYQDVT